MEGQLRDEDKCITAQKTIYNLTVAAKAPMQVKIGAKVTVMEQTLAGTGGGVIKANRKAFKRPRTQIVLIKAQLRKIPPSEKAVDQQ